MPAQKSKKGQYYMAEVKSQGRFVVPQGAIAEAKMTDVGCFAVIHDRKNHRVIMEAYSPYSKGHNKASLISPFYTTNAVQMSKSHLVKSNIDSTKIKIKATDKQIRIFSA